MSLTSLIKQKMIAQFGQYNYATQNNRYKNALNVLVYEFDQYVVHVYASSEKIKYGNLIEFISYVKRCRVSDDSYTHVGVIFCGTSMSTESKNLINESEEFGVNFDMIDGQYGTSAAKIQKIVDHIMDYSDDEYRDKSKKKYDDSDDEKKSRSSFDSDEENATIKPAMRKYITSKKLESDDESSESEKDSDSESDKLTEGVKSQYDQEYKLQMMKNVLTNCEKILLSVNIAVVGCINAGKSTLLNAMLSGISSTCKMQRSTMLPQVYGEVVNTVTDFCTIRQINDQINNRLYEEQKKNKSIQFKCEEIAHNIGQISSFVGLENGLTYKIYDIPGINDAKTKEQCMNYLIDNFYKFDVIIYVVDVNNALQTTDEMNVTTTLIQQLSKFKQSGIDKHMITLVNKIDDLECDEGVYSVRNVELMQMFNQTTINIKQLASEYHVEQLCKHIIPICAEDAFVYRYLAFNDKIELDSKYIDRIGFNEHGKTCWNKFADKAKEIAKIKKELENEKEYTRRMTICGFDNYVKCLSNVLTKDFQYDCNMNKIRLFDAFKGGVRDDSCSDMIFNNLNDALKMYKLEDQLIKIFPEQSKSINRTLKYISVAYEYKQLMRPMLSDLSEVNKCLDFAIKLNELYDHKNSYYDKLSESIINLTKAKWQAVKENFHQIDDDDLFDSVKLLIQSYINKKDLFKMLIKKLRGDGISEGVCKCIELFEDVYGGIITRHFIYTLFSVCKLSLTKIGHYSLLKYIPNKCLRLSYMINEKYNTDAYKYDYDIMYSKFNCSQIELDALMFSATYKKLIDIYARLTPDIITQEYVNNENNVLHDAFYDSDADSDSDSDAVVDKKVKEKVTSKSKRLPAKAGRPMAKKTPLKKQCQKKKNILYESESDSSTDIDSDSD